MLTEEQLRKLITHGEYGSTKATADVLRTLTDMFGGELPTDLQTAILALVAGLYREVLTANRTYYVRTDGSNSNDGLANTAQGAFATPQKAWDVIQNTLDLNGFTVTVRIGDGTYTTSLNCTGTVVGQEIASSVTFRSDSGNNTACIISVTSGNALAVVTGAKISIRDIKLETTGGGSDCLLLTDPGSTVQMNNLNFGASVRYHIEVRRGALLQQFSNYSITGGAGRHIFVTSNGIAEFDSVGTVTITGTPAFTTFARASICGSIYINNARVTWSGSATGQRYFVTGSAAIDTDGGGASYIPGSTAGSNDSGNGFYG